MANQRTRERTNRSAQTRRANNLRRYNERRRLTRPCQVSVGRVAVPEATHTANESSQPLLEQPTQGLTGPICRSGIVRHEVDPNWPIGHRLFFQCRFQVRLITLDSCFIHFFR